MHKVYSDLFDDPHEQLRRAAGIAHTEDLLRNSINMAQTAADIALDAGVLDHYYEMNSVAGQLKRLNQATLGDAVGIRGLLDDHIEQMAESCLAFPTEMAERAGILGSVRSMLGSSVQNVLSSHYDSFKSIGESFGFFPEVDSIQSMLGDHIQELNEALSPKGLIEELMGSISSLGAVRHDLLAQVATFNDLPHIDDCFASLLEGPKAKAASIERLFDTLCDNEAEVSDEIAEASKADSNFTLLSPEAKDYIKKALFILYVVLPYIFMLYQAEITAFWKQKVQPLYWKAKSPQVRTSIIKECDFYLPDHRIVSTRDDDLIVRNEPGKKHKEVGRLPAGTLVLMHEPDRDVHRSWIRISAELDDGEVVEGWVYRRYTTPLLQTGCL